MEPTTRVHAQATQVEYPNPDMRVILRGDYQPYARVLHGEELDYAETCALECWGNYYGWGNPLEVLEKRARRAGLYAHAGETRGYTQGDYAEYLLTSEDEITKDDIREFERWLWGDVYLCTLETLTTYTSADGDTVELWRAYYDDSNGVHLADMWELENEVYSDYRVVYADAC